MSRAGSELPGISHHEVKVRIVVDGRTQPGVVVCELFPCHLWGGGRGRGGEREGGEREGGREGGGEGGREGGGERGRGAAKASLMIEQAH